MTIIAELRLTLDDHRGVIASVGIMALLAIFLNYRFMDMSHLQHCIKFFLVAEDTEFPSSTDKKILIPRRVIYMTEDASPFFCWSMGLFQILRSKNIFMSS